MKIKQVLAFLVIASVAMAVVAGVWKVFPRVRDVIFPTYANYVTTKDTAPIDITFKSLNGDIDWKIPKAYLTWSPNWKGGQQRTIELEAALRWEPPGLPPWTLQKERPRSGSYGDHMYITLAYSVPFFNEQMWREQYLHSMEPVGTVGDLASYMHVEKTDKALDEDRRTRILRPIVEHDPPVYFACSVSNSHLVACSAYTTFSDVVTVRYIFDAALIGRWKEIDSRVRQLLTTLRQGNHPKGFPRENKAL